MEMPEDHRRPTGDGTKHAQHHQVVGEVKQNCSWEYANWLSEGHGYMNIRQPDKRGEATDFGQNVPLHFES